MFHICFPWNKTHSKDVPTISDFTAYLYKVSFWALNRKSNINCKIWNEIFNHVQIQNKERDRRYQHVINILQIKIEGYKQKHVAKTNQRQNNIQLAKHED